MNQAQRAQRLNQGQLAAVKFAELFVAVHQRAQLACALRALAREQHPQVLHRRAAARVVQVHKVRSGTRRAFRRPQNIAGVAVAVQAQRGHRAGSLHHALGHLHGFVKRAAPARGHVQRQVVAGQQQVAAGVAEALDVQRRPLCKRYCRAHGVDARQKAANPFKHRQLIELGPAPAAARRHAEGKTGEVVQRLALQAQRANHRNLSAHQLSGKSVLFQNLRIAPAAGAVKLGHHGVAGSLGLTVTGCGAFQ